MASLNTLRTRGGIIISVVICIALLAFLLPDLGVGNNMNSDDRKVGVINGNKIDVMDYSRQIEDATNVMKIGRGSDRISNEEQEYARSQAWGNLLYQYSFKPGMESLGLTVSEEEQVDMVSGTYISQILAPFMDPSTGQLNQEALRNFMASVQADGSGQLAFYWESMKEQMQVERMFSKFTALVQKGAFVTDLELRYGVQEANDTYDGKFAALPYTSIPDSTVAVTSSEVRSFYNANKDMFRQSASRDVEYVVFEMTPSEADMEAARKQVDEIAAEFAAAENPMQYATLNSTVKPDTRYYTADQIDATIAKTLVEGGEKIYGPVLEDDVFIMARLGEWLSLPDTIGARQIVVAGGKAQADSIKNAIESGVSTFEQVLASSIDPDAQSNGGDMGYFTPGDDDFSREAVKTAEGKCFTMEQGPYAYVIQITEKTAPRRKVQVARVVYNVVASDATQQEIYSQANRFYAAAANSADDFQKAATEMALAKRVAYIQNTDRTVNGVENSGSMVNWAFNNKLGSVSTILEIDGDYMVACLTGVREDGIAPLEQVAADIEMKLRYDKKGDMLAAKMKGSSVDAVAASSGAETFDFSGIQFAEFFVENAGVEPKLVGAFAGVAKDAVSKPVKGNAGVYVFTVNNVGKIAEPVSEQDVKVRMEAMQDYAGQSLIFDALEDGTDIKDYRAKFY